MGLDNLLFLPWRLLILIIFHWRIQGALPACVPPTGSISFVFAYVFAKKCTHRRLAPPMGRRPPTGNPGSATVFIWWTNGLRSIEQTFKVCGVRNRCYTCAQKFNTAVLNDFGFYNI